MGWLVDCHTWRKYDTAPSPKPISVRRADSIKEHSMKKVKAALLGLDNPHSVAHLKTLQQLPEVESILIWSEREELDASLEEASSEMVESVADLVDKPQNEAKVL